MTWILVIVAVTTGSADHDGVSIRQMRFGSRQACEIVRDNVVMVYRLKDIHTKIDAHCAREEDSI